jgi:hypothetical protein
LKLVLSSAVLGAVLLITGCGGTQCEQVCSQYDACTVAQRSINVDCIDFCSNVDAVNARAAAAGFTGGSAAWTTHLNCWSSHISSICDTNFADCDQSALDWRLTVDPYCDQVIAQEKFDAACQGEFEGFDTNVSVISPFQSGF